MAECHENIVFRKDGVEDKVSAAVANDDSALVKAYEEAVQSFQNSNDVKQNIEKVGGSLQKPIDSDVPCEEPADSKWEVGSHCNAMWSKDGLVYPATVVWLEGEQCRVKFDGYGNEEEMGLSALLPEAADQPFKERQVWRLGSRCRAVYSEDRLVYPAVLVWMKGERCRVKFDVYGNEEELEQCALLPPEEQGGQSGQAAAKSMNRDRLTSTSSSDWRRKDKHKEQPSPLPPNFASGKEWGKSNSYHGKEQGTKKNSSWKEDSKQRSIHPLPFFPPVPPPPPNSADFPSFFPPHLAPPCMWPPRPGLDNTSNGPDSDVSALSSMLLSWYLCGYHTGYYMGRQQTEVSCKLADKEKDEASCTEE